MWHSACRRHRRACSRCLPNPSNDRSRSIAAKDMVSSNRGASHPDCATMRSLAPGHHRCGMYGGDLPLDDPERGVQPVEEDLRAQPVGLHFAVEVRSLDLLERPGASSAAASDTVKRRLLRASFAQATIPVLLARLAAHAPGGSSGPRPATFRASRYDNIARNVDQNRQMLTRMLRRGHKKAETPEKSGASATWVPGKGL